MVHMQQEMKQKSAGGKQEEHPSCGYISSKVGLGG